MQASGGLGAPFSHAQGLIRWWTWPLLILKGGMCLGEPARGRREREVYRCVLTMPKPSPLSGCSRCCLGWALCLFGTIGSNCQPCAQL